MLNEYFYFEITISLSLTLPVLVHVSVTADVHNIALLPNFRAPFTSELHLTFFTSPKTQDTSNVYKSIIEHFNNGIKKFLSPMP